MLVYTTQTCSTLRLDMAGPVKPGLDVSSKGTMGRGLKYIFVAKYIFPKEFARAYSGHDPPPNHGMEPPTDVDSQEKEPRGVDDQELAKPSLLPPREEAEDLGEELGVLEDYLDDKELAKPSLLPPREEAEDLGEELTILMTRNSRNLLYYHHVKRQIRLF